MGSTVEGLAILFCTLIVLTVGAAAYPIDELDLQPSSTLWFARQWNYGAGPYPGGPYPPPPNYQQQPYPPPYQPPPNPNYSGWGPARPPPPPGYLPNSNPNPQIDYSNYAVHGGHGFGSYGIYK
ncbi:nematocyst expressed protein 4-like [Adelges cooleyi]|uniref:nematocyst expressed protein 4-like n=1 Tax=Adelges cooleyi TaxID=133065 RepID=UPI00218073DE|nr:nematocyst expressed protein 4-like [Adelges cooleyi]